MDFENRTPFPAIHYEVVDAAGTEWLVIAARALYDLRPAAGGEATHLAVAAREQGDLVFTDRYHGELNRSSVKQESDLAQHKPRCDVVLIASAWSPTGEPVPRVDVRVHLHRVEPIDGLAEPGPLLDHRLTVHGARWFERRGGAFVLGEAEPFVTLPLRYEHAFGGELEVHAEDDAAARLRDADRLDEEARKSHPKGEDRAPLAHTTATWNPVGVGFLERWYADAARVDRWPAPRIESPAAPLTADVFEQLVRGEVQVGAVPALVPRGVGVIAKPWQPRLALAGTFDQRWLAEVWPRMPADFDMAYWNGAHPDMQCPHLWGSERVELTHVLPRERGGGMRFELPIEGLVLRLVAHGVPADHLPALIDTVVIDLDAMQLALTFRARIPKAAAPLRAELVSVAHLEDPPA